MHAYNKPLHIWLEIVAVADPGVHSGHMIRVTGRSPDADLVKVRIHLKQGTTNLGWWSHEFGDTTSIARIGVPASNASGVTDYADVRTRIAKWHEVLSQGDRRAEIRKIKFEVPE